MLDHIDRRSTHALRIALIGTLASVAALLWMLCVAQPALPQFLVVPKNERRPVVDAAQPAPVSKPELVSTYPRPAVPRQETAVVDPAEISRELARRPCKESIPVMDFIGPAGDCYHAWEDTKKGVELIPLIAMAPKYPLVAKRDHIEGWVDVQITIDAGGFVKSAHVSNARPRGVFESAAVQAAFKSRFRPNVVDGQAIEATGTRRYNFTLPEG